MPCAPSVSPSQLLSYCYTQLGHIYLLLEPQNEPCTFRAARFQFWSTSLSAGNGQVKNNAGKRVQRPSSFFSSRAQSVTAVYFNWVVYLVNLSSRRPLSGWLRAALLLAPAHPIPLKPVTPGQPLCVRLGSSPISEMHQKRKTRLHVSFGQLILPSTGLELPSSPCHYTAHTPLFDLVMVCVLSLYLLDCFHDLPCMPILKYHCGCCYL